MPSDRIYTCNKKIRKNICFFIAQLDLYAYFCSVKSLSSGIVDRDLTGKFIIVV